MASGTIYKVERRRRRQGKTDYRKRYKTIKGGERRLVTRISANNVIAQIVEYSAQGDKTVVNTTAKELKKYGWNGHNGNASAAYLTGVLCGKKCAKIKITTAVFDIGLHTPVHGSNVFAVLKGALDAGMKINHDPKCLPKEERLMGKDVESFRKVKLNVAGVKQKIMGA